MNNELRIIKASILTGFTDIVFGGIMYVTGWSDWYYNHFHVFGVFGFSMLAYGYWHLLFLVNETGSVEIWKKNKQKK